MKFDNIINVYIVHLHINIMDIIYICISINNTNFGIRLVFLAFDKLSLDLI